MATADQTKARIFDLCCELMEKNGPDFTNAQLEARAGSTNKQTLLKYLAQFRAVIPVAQALPHMGWRQWEALSEMNQASELLTQNAKAPLERELQQQSDTILAVETERDELKRKNDELEAELLKYEKAITTINNETAEEVLGLEKKVSDLQQQLTLSQSTLEQVKAASSSESTLLKEQLKEAQQTLLQERTVFKETITDHRTLNESLNQRLLASEARVKSLETPAKNRHRMTPSRLNRG